VVTLNHVLGMHLFSNKFEGVKLIMNKICAKIYYLISTGEVLTITSEMQGSVQLSTKKQDMEVCPQLKDKSIDDRIRIWYFGKYCY
jgi:hypothetical protein